jgi:tetratricopeptide (TPR) repeat protein
MPAVAYVRRKGNQLAVVHGVRDSETQQVEQRTLFTLYSKAEALAAVGDRAHHFRQILESDNPGVRFDWKKIDREIRSELSHLPDLYTFKQERAEGGFRTAIVEFARELLLHDPQHLISSARLIQAHRHELAYLRELIEWRLELCDQQESEWNQDNPFYWRAASHRREVPPEAWEKLEVLFDRGQHDEAEALARLLIECWPNFATGINYLGMLAMERERWETALGHFDEAIRVGRTLFAKRIPKDSYWSDHDTRPYIRAIIFKAHALSRLERYEEALQLCDRLEEECGQDIYAALERVPILLNSGRWDAAIAAAKYVHNLYPDQNFALAFAYFEDGNSDEAVVHFMSAAIEKPRAARMLLRVGRCRDPKGPEEIDDHNTGVSLSRDLAPFLRRWRPQAKTFFKRILASKEMRALIERFDEARQGWRTETSADRTWYDRMMEMRTVPFARAEAAKMGWLSRPPRRVSSKRRK